MPPRQNAELPVSMKPQVPPPQSSYVQVPKVTMEAADTESLSWGHTSTGLSMGITPQVNRALGSPYHIPQKQRAHKCD